MAGTLGFTSSLHLDPGTGAYVLIDNAATINIPTQSVGKSETTNMQTTGMSKTFVPTLTEPGMSSFEDLYTKATFAQLAAVFGKAKITSQVPATGANVNWKLISASEDGTTAGTTAVFNGWLSKLDMPCEVESVMKIKGEITVAGAVTLS